LGNEMRDVRLSYYLGQTTITVSGTVTFHYDNVGDPRHFDRTAFVSTGIGADTSQAYELVLRRRRLFRGDTEIDLSLAPDGRLLGVGFEANGGGADAAGGMVAVLTLSATVATAAAAVAAAAPAAVALFKAARLTAVDLTRQQDRAAAAADPGDGSDWGELSARAAVARKLAWDLQERALDLAQQAAGDNPPTSLGDQIKTVSTSLDLARAELANLQQALKGWQSRHYPDQSASFTYRFGLDDLAPVPEPVAQLRQPLNKLSEAARDAACTLHTIVLRVDDPAAADPPATSTAQAVRPAAGDRPGSNDQKIHYRAPFRAQLAIYELAQNADVDLTKVLVDLPLDWRLRQVVPIWALGKKSDEKTLDVFTPRFGRSSVQVDFGDSGAVSHISVADVGPIANLSNTLSGAVQASGGGGSPAPAAGGSAPPAAASAGSGATQDPVLAPLQMEAAVKKVQADIAGYDKTIRDSQTDAQPPKQGGGK
jgi:hypothetical protein